MYMAISPTSNSTYSVFQSSAMVQTATLSSQASVSRDTAVMKAREPSGFIEETADPFTDLELYNPPVGTTNLHLVLYIN